MSLAAFPAPASVEVTAVVVFRKLPAAVASTFTLKVQLPPGGSVAPRPRSGHCGNHTPAAAA